MGLFNGGKKMSEDEMEKEIFDTVRKIKSEFFRLLSQKYPQYVIMYEMRYEYINFQFIFV